MRRRRTRSPWSRWNRKVAEIFALRQEGDVPFVPIVEEFIVVTKRSPILKEVDIRRVKSSEHVKRSIELRQQRTVLERTDVEND